MQDRTPQLTADAVVFTDARKRGDGHANWHVLLIRRAYAPYEGQLALPGGKLEHDETLRHCATRELKEETGLEVRERAGVQVGTYDALQRDPRGRYISTAFAWVHHAGAVDVKGADDAKEALWVPVIAAVDLAFDHGDIVNRAWQMLINP